MEAKRRKEAKSINLKTRVEILLRYLGGEPQVCRFNGLVFKTRSGKLEPGSTHDRQGRARHGAGGSGGA